MFVSLQQNKDKDQKEKGEQLQNKSDQQLSIILKKVENGCGKIFHKPGYKNSKGDGLYDFTCDRSHLCSKCESIQSSARFEVTKRGQIIEGKAQQIRHNKNIQEIEATYFRGEKGCKCEKDDMCDTCLDKLQKKVTELQAGCGAQWQQNFGGMAAGPATVTCKDNYFLCDSCSKQLHFINQALKTHPKVILKRIPEGEKPFWSPSSSGPKW